MRLVPLARRHVKEIAAIERESFSCPWSEAAFLDELENPLAHYIVCEGDAGVLGYVGTRVLDSEVYITNVAVGPQHRRLGIGSLLIEGLLKAVAQSGAELITLEVRVSNRAAIQLYEKHGFSILGVRPNYYTLPDEDAYIMTRFFKEVYVDTGI